MMSKMSVFALFSVAAATETTVNPIRKVVTLLQEMQKEVTAEGEKEADLMQKFNCYCKNGAGDLTAQIEAETAENAEMTAAMEAASAEKKQTDEELKKAKADRVEAKAALAKATAIREKENKAYVALTSEFSEDLEAMKGAIAALEKGMTGFLQTSTGAKLRSVMEKHAESLDVDDKEALAAFIQGDYVPQSGQIVGILKNMVDVMAGDKADEIAKEEAAVKAFEELSAAKKKEIASLSEQIEAKTQKSGELAVKIVETKNAAEDAAESAADNQKFAANLEKSCAEKNAQYEERKAVRADEVVAISKAIAILNEDDALDLFKKTLKSPEKVAPAAFLQKSTKTDVKAKALALLSKKSSSPAVALMQNTIKNQLKEGKVDFSKVITMIDDMVKILGEEQVTDDNEKKYCETEFDTSDDKKKALTRKQGEEETKIAETTDTIKTLSEQIAALEAEIAALDKSVAEATEQRKAENTEFTQMMAENNMAKALIEKAKNRLNKFYNPDLYVRSEEEKKVGETMGDKMAAQGAQFAFIQTSMSQPGPAPETFTGSYSGKGQKSNSVIALMDMLIKELDTDMQEAEHEEKTAQEDYEELMAESAKSRADNSKSVTDKSAAKADAETTLADTKDDLAMTTSELKANAEYIANLHTQCDFLLANFDVRKEARTSEIEGLKNAKAVLSGASYSFF